MMDLINEILATLKHNKLRTALTGFAVSWGIFLLIVLLSAARGVINGFEERMGQRDNDLIKVWGGWAQKPYKGLKEGRPVMLRDNDEEILLAQNSRTISSVTAQMSSDTAKVSTSKDYLTDGYSGVYPESQRAENLTMAYGRFINELDMQNRRRVVVLSSRSVPILFEKENPVGEMVTISGLTFTVVGIYSHEHRREVYIPFTTAKSLAGGTDKVNQLTVKLNNVTTMAEGEQAERDMRATLGRQHEFDVDDESAVWTWNMLTSYLSNNMAMMALVYAVWIIGVLTLLSGIVGVSNIMFVSVRERTHEIGIRRAIGARPRSILTQVILEGVSITTLFGYIGIVAGMGVAKIIGTLTAGSGVLVNPTITLTMAVEVTVVLIVAGAVAGLFPAIKALKIKPVEALRDE
ncbi:MAG: ABC transporter permease [Duncaniella sp.]|nr:ABC transporter permease [Duncaniella sp.]